MTKDIQKENKNIITFPWVTLDLSDQAQLTQFKTSYAVWATPQELWMFIAIIKTTWLNPFKREIWFVKYWSGQAQIFIGRDGYRKVAKAHSKYLWHRVDVVCENDTFKVKNGQVEEHSYEVKERGKIIWAYCIAKVEWQSEPIMHFVDFSEYNTWKSKWLTSPKTMIKKVAEAQTLRMAFDDLLEGTYDESEQGQFDNSITNAGVISPEDIKNNLESKFKEND